MALKLKVRSTLPATILEGVGIKVAKDGLTQTVGLDYSELVAVTNDPMLRVLGYNPITGEYGAVTISSFVTAVTRERLYANRTYYVRTDGSDASNGQADAPGGAFLTPQAAIYAIQRIDLNGFNVTIKYGPGTYTGGLFVDSPFFGTGTVTVLGDATTPTNCVMAVAGGDCIKVTGAGSKLRVRGFKLTTSGGAGVPLNAINGGAIEYGDVVFSTVATNGSYVSFDYQGRVHQFGDVAIGDVTGGAPFFWLHGDYLASYSTDPYVKLTFLNPATAFQAGGALFGIRNCNIALNAPDFVNPTYFTSPKFIVHRGAHLDFPATPVATYTAALNLIPGTGQTLWSGGKLCQFVGLNALVAPGEHVNGLAQSYSNATFGHGHALCAGIGVATDWLLTNRDGYAVAQIPPNSRDLRVGAGAGNLIVDNGIKLNGSTSGVGTLNPPTVASTYAWTLPAATDTLVGKATTDTLTNKTLTSPAINSPTGIVKGDVGLGNVDNTSDASKPVSTAQATSIATKISNVVVQTFTANGTYTPTPNMAFCQIECVGGGGGGGGSLGVVSTFYTGGGGGAGGLSRLLATAATIGASKAVTIGAAGTSSTGSGGNGGDTSVGSLCIGKGGAGGIGATAGVLPQGGAGGVVGTGDTSSPGVPGQGGNWGASIALIGNGGSTLYGASGVVVFSSGAAASPTASTGYGAGGSGSSSHGAFNGTGGVGTAGFVRITEYIK